MSATLCGTAKEEPAICQLPVARPTPTPTPNRTDAMLIKKQENKNNIHASIKPSHVGCLLPSASFLLPLPKSGCCCCCLPTANLTNKLRRAAPKSATVNGHQTASTQVLPQLLVRTPFSGPKCFVSVLIWYAAGGRRKAAGAIAICQFCSCSPSWTLDGV